MPRELQIKDVVRLLRSEVKKAGGQQAWAEKTGIERTIVNKILNGQRQPTNNILKALNLRVGILSN
jgi:DNA-binding phage protein